MRSTDPVNPELDSTNYMPTIDRMTFLTLHLKKLLSKFKC